MLIVNDSTTHTMTWNEENRLMILSDADYVSRYTYDYTGNRVIKSHGPMTTIYINGVLQGVDMHDDENYTLYVSPYMTVNADRFTKYYYAGTQRIASKLGSGKFDNVYGVNGFHLTAGGKDYAERSVQMVKGVQEYYKQAGVTPGVPNQQGQHANPYISGTAYPSVPLGNYDVPTGWPGPVARRQQGQVFGPPVSFLREAPQEAKSGVGFKSDHQREDNLFYFHSDHLGSTSYLTDTAGNVSQFVWYAPYGEALVDEHTTTYENPFKFSGKELDDITGLYDHGARNRNPITAVWYGIDELFEKYPENGPYGYCGGNPIRFVDLDGRKLDENDAETFEHINAIKDALYSAKVQIENERNQLQNSSELSGKDKARLNDLNKRHKEIIRSINRMKKVIEDPKHIFRIRTTNSKTADIKPSVDEIREGIITLVYVKGDMGNAIHEVIVHGSQIAWGKTWYQIINGKVIRYIKEGINEYDIEVEAYRAQYAYGGVLEGYETPAYDCSSCNFNTDEQINDFFSIRSIDEITRWKVKIMQRGQIGNNLLYGKKKK